MLTCLLFNGKADLWFEMVWGSCDKADDDSELFEDSTEGSAPVPPFWEIGNVPLKMSEKLNGH